MELKQDQSHDNPMLEELLEMSVDGLNFTKDNVYNPENSEILVTFQQENNVLRDQVQKLTQENQKLKNQDIMQRLEAKQREQSQLQGEQDLKLYGQSLHDIGQRQKEDLQTMRQTILQISDMIENQEKFSESLSLASSKLYQSAIKEKEQNDLLMFSISVKEDNIKNQADTLQQKDAKIQQLEQQVVSQQQRMKEIVRKSAQQLELKEKLQKELDVQLLQNEELKKKANVLEFENKRLQESVHSQKLVAEKQCEDIKREFLAVQFKSELLQKEIQHYQQQNNNENNNSQYQFEQDQQADIELEQIVYNLRLEMQLKDNQMKILSQTVFDLESDRDVYLNQLEQCTKTIEKLSEQNSELTDQINLRDVQIKENQKCFGEIEKEYKINKEALQSYIDKFGKLDHEDYIQQIYERCLQQQAEKQYQNKGNSWLHYYQNQNQLDETETISLFKTQATQLMLTLSRRLAAFKTRLTFKFE